MSDHTTPIRDVLTSRNVELERIYAMTDDTAESFDPDEASAELDTFALSVDTKLHVEVLLACGGPTEWVDIVCEVERKTWGTEHDYADVAPVSMTYHYSWATEGAEASVQLHEDDAMWRFCAEQIEAGVTL